MQRRKPEAPRSKHAGTGGAAPAKAPAKRERDADSDDIERAVYDGMQDLRERPSKK